MVKVRYTPFERLVFDRAVDRIDHLSQLVAGKTVLDLGAYDGTAFDKKGSRYWLHGRMAETAARVVGVDNADNLPAEGLTTSPTSRIVKGSIFDLDKLVDLDTIETVVAGEVIEHLPDTLSFLTYLKSLKKLQGKTFILSTPNAASLSNVLLGALGMENNDVNHLQVYSYKTLHSLFLRAGFKEWRFTPYHEIFPEMIERSPAHLKVATVVFERTLRFCDYLFPMLCGGWIAIIEI